MTDKLPELKCAWCNKPESDCISFGEKCSDDMGITLGSVRAREQYIIEKLKVDVWKPTGQRRAILLLIEELEKGQK